MQSFTQSSPCIRSNSGLRKLCVGFSLRALRFIYPSTHSKSTCKLSFVGINTHFPSLFCANPSKTLIFVLSKKMRIPVRIFSFLSVAVLLAFFGKVSKVQLFEGFIRTIQDVETRNSTGFELNQASLPDAVAVAVAPKTITPNFFGISFSSRSILEFVPVFSGEIQSLVGESIAPLCRFFLTAQFTAAP